MQQTASGKDRAEPAVTLREIGTNWKSRSRAYFYANNGVARLVIAKKRRKAVQKESSSAFFTRIRPKFLDWTPPTPDERLLEAQKRREDRDAHTKKLIEREEAKQANKKLGGKKS